MKGGIGSSPSPRSAGMIRATCSNCPSKWGHSILYLLAGCETARRVTKSSEAVSSRKMEGHSTPRHHTVEGAGRWFGHAGRARIEARLARRGRAESTTRRHKMRLLYYTCDAQDGASYTTRAGPPARKCGPRCSTTSRSSTLIRAVIRCSRISALWHSSASGHNSAARHNPTVHETEAGPSRPRIRLRGGVA